MKLLFILVSCFHLQPTSGYLHYLMGMEETLLYSNGDHIAVCPNGGEPMKQKMKTYGECMGTVAEKIDSLGQALGPEEFRRIANLLKRALSADSILRMASNAAAQFCRSSKPKLDCFQSLIPTLMTCNSTRSADAVRFFTAVNQVQRAVCSRGGAKYAEYYREQLSRDCFDASRNRCTGRLGPMWLDYLQGKNESLFTPDNCKSLKAAGDCIIDGLDSCSQKKTAAVFKSVHRTVLVHACGSDYY